MKHKFIADRVIYKFYAINSDNLNSLNDHKIWLSHPSRFNDPFDAKLRIHGEEDFEILDKIADFLIGGDKELEPYFSAESLKVHLGEWIDGDPSKAIPPAFTDSFEFALRNSKKDVSQLISFLKKEMPNALALKNFMATYFCLGVSSFATEPHDPKMWSSYGNDHKGVCVRYVLTSNEFNTQDELHCTSVSYKDGPHGSHDSSGAFELESILDQLSLKSRDWVNEREVRLISLNRSNRLVEVPGLKMTGICCVLVLSFKLLALIEFTP